MLNLGNAKESEKTKYPGFPDVNINRRPGGYYELHHCPGKDVQKN
jgi:hypothetical protein